MITLILLTLIYLAFISLGLPDALLGVSWPIMRGEFGMPLDGAAPIAFAITISTMTSSLLSGYIIKKLGTGKVIFISCLMTSLALLGVSFAPSYMWLILIAIPLGFGGGSVDTALNHYVAIHFKAHHMNWLHSFWGVGATAGPLVMSTYLVGDAAWRLGYRTVGFMQLGLSLILLLSLPLWKMHKDAVNKASENSTQADPDKFKTLKPLKVPGVLFALLTFVAYCAVEGSVGLWGSSYLIETKSISPDTAATWVALYYGGIALGRFIFGFISFKMSNTRMIQVGINILALGVIFMLLPINGNFALLSLIFIGFGLAPIFPAMIHMTPERFGGHHAPTIIGYQMASANIGLAFVVPMIGVILDSTAMTVYPFLIVALIAIIYLSTTRLKHLYNPK